MNLSDFDPKDIKPVQPGKPIAPQIIAPGQDAPSPKPLNLSDFDPKEVTLVKKAPSEGESALRGAISMATAGFDDEITGDLGGAGRVFGIKNLGSWKPFDPNSHIETTDEPLSADAIVEAYRNNRDAIRDEQKTDMQINPKATIAGNFAGALVSPIAKIGQASEGAQTLVQAMRAGAIHGLAQGAIYGAGGSDADLTKGEVGDFARDTVGGAVTGGIIGGAAPAAIGGVKYGAQKGGQLANWTGRKLLTSLTGVSEDNAAQYLARRSAINAAPELATIKDGVDSDVKKLSDAVDSGKMHVNDAKSALNDLKLQVRNQLTDAKVDARDAVRRTEDMFKEAAAKVIQPIKDTSAPTNLASDVVNAVGDLKSGVIDKSNAAWDTLENSDKTFPTKVVKGAVTNSMNSLKVGGGEGGAVGQSSQAAINSLNNLRSQLDSLPDRLSMPQVKQIIKNLDRDINWRGGAGEFMDPASQEKAGIRSSMDAYLKRNVPEYAQAMDPVAKDASLLSNVAKGFGDERSAIGRLGQVASPRGALDREALAQLEQATGRPGQFTSAIDNYTRAQSILKDPQAIEQMKRALPEYGSYRQAMAKLAKMKPDWSRDQLERALSTSKEARSLSMAEDALSKAQSTYEPISGLNQASSQSKLESFLKPKGPSIENERALQSLDQMTGKNYTQQLKDRAVLDSFEKGNTHGSRNTLLGAAIGFAFHGVTGAAAGAAFGSQVMDRYGPKVGKAILDGVGRIQESPSLKTIQSLSLPQNVKDNLAREFQIYMVNRNSGFNQAPGMVADRNNKEDRSPSQAATLKGENKWASDGLNKLGLYDQSLLQDGKAKNLLIEAHSPATTSKRLQEIKNQLSKGMGNK